MAPGCFLTKTGHRKASGFDNEGGMAAFEWYMNAIHDLKIAPAPEQITGLATEGITDPFAAGKGRHVPNRYSLAGLSRESDQGPVCLG